MCVISFQGACLFQADGGRILVHLPAADFCPDHPEEQPDCPHHLDGTRAERHHARLFVDRRVRMRHEGMTECSSIASRDDEVETRLEGFFFPLSEGRPARKYRIRVSPQGGSVPSVSDLRSALPRIETLAPEVGDPTGEHNAAIVEIEGGSFTFARGRSLDWVATKMRSGDRPTKVEDLGKLAWRVEWNVGASPGQPVRISVLGDDGSERAWVEVMSRGMASDRIIIGNLDDSNPAKWPFRPIQDTGHCVGGDCPDQDFKWLYRAYSWTAVKEALEKASVDRLPVPRLKDPLQHGLEDGLGLDTPTCFPGTD